MTDTVTVTPDYASIEPIRDLCEPWIELWGGDEWGESMRGLDAACHTSYGFSDEDCALFASKLIENLIAQKEWVDTEGHSYGFWEPERVAAAQEQCRQARDYWAKGGNLTGDEHSVKTAQATLETIPKWMFGETMATTSRFSTAQFADRLSDAGIDSKRASRVGKSLRDADADIQSAAAEWGRTGEFPEEPTIEDYSPRELAGFLDPDEVFTTLVGLRTNPQPTLEMLQHPTDLAAFADLPEDDEV